MSELLQVASALMRASRETEVRVLATVVRRERRVHAQHGCPISLRQLVPLSGTAELGCRPRASSRAPFINSRQHSSSRAPFYEKWTRRRTQPSTYHSSKRRMGPGFDEYYTIDKGLAGGRPNVPPPYVAMCHLLVRSRVGGVLAVFVWTALLEEVNMTARLMARDHPPWHGFRAPQSA